MVFHRVKRQIHTNGQTELTGPHAAGEHDPFSADFLPTFQAHPGDPLASMRTGHFQQRGHACSVKEGSSVSHGAFGESHRAFAGYHSSIAGQIDCPQHILHLNERPELLSFLGTNEMGLDPEHLRHRGGPTELGHALRVGPECQAGGTNPSHVMTRLLGQLGVKLGRVFVDLGHAVAGAQLPDHAGRMPSGAATEQALLQQHDILPARLGQMVGHRTAHNAPSDNDYTGSRRRRSKRQREGGLDWGVADVGGRHDR